MCNHFSKQGFQAWILWHSCLWYIWNKPWPAMVYFMGKNATNYELCTMKSPFEVRCEHLMCACVHVSVHASMWLDLRKLTISAQWVECILLLHIIGTLIHHDKMFFHAAFLAVQNTEKPVQMVRPLEGSIGQHGSRVSSRHLLYLLL